MGISDLERLRNDKGGGFSLVAKVGGPGVLFGPGLFEFLVTESMQLVSSYSRGLINEKSVLREEFLASLRGKHAKI